MITYTITLQELPGGFVNVDLMAPPGKATAREIMAASKLHEALTRFVRDSKGTYLKPWQPPGKSKQN